MGSSRQVNLVPRKSKQVAQFSIAMVRFTLLAAATAALLPSVFAHPANGPRSSKMGCGTEPSAEFLAKSEEMAALETNSSTIADFSATATITIQTYFHVVARSTAASGGYIPQSSLTQQLAVMNSNYGEPSCTGKRVKP
jgi:hypothetical protein